jgi:hypothetical protein
LPDDHSSAPRRKRVGSAIAAHRCRSLRRRPAAEPVYALGYLVGSEAKPRARAGSEPHRTERLGVVIDPAARDAEKIRDLSGREHLPPYARALGLRRRRSKDLRQVAGERLDRLGREPDLRGAMGRAMADSG